ncbi:MAG TPA: hypothetical protein VH724_11395 [Candidatus Angelobacter sp.]|nr:hypothetical protein [Candidatus Angelobacter sp.]
MSRYGLPIDSSSGGKKLSKKGNTRTPIRMAFIKNALWQNALRQKALRQNQLKTKGGLTKISKRDSAADKPYPDGQI